MVTHEVFRDLFEVFCKHEDKHEDDGLGLVDTWSRDQILAGHWSAHLRIIKRRNLKRLISMCQLFYLTSED